MTRRALCLFFLRFTVGWVQCQKIILDYLLIALIYSSLEISRLVQISRLILRCCSIIPLSLLITYYFCIIMSFCLNSRLPAAEGSDPVSCFYWLQKERKKLLQFSPKRFNLLTCKYRTSQVGAGFFVVLTVTCVQPHID